MNGSCRTSDLRKPARLPIAVLLMLCAAARMTGQSQAPKPLPKISYPAIDRFIEDRMKRGGIPGLALAITKGPDVLYAKGCGRARDGEPVTPQTRFFIASISKSFTALAVMQLVEAGRLELDAPVRRYLPQFRVNHANAASRITIRHLLNHTSGLADPGFPEGRLPEPSSIAERVATLRTARPIAAPGAEFHYFNPNYAVLARVSEVVNKRPFHDYLRTHVLNMTPLLFSRVNQPLPCGRGSVNVLSRDRKGVDAQLFLTLCLDRLGMSQTLSVVTSAEAFPLKNLAQGHLMAFGLPVPAQEMRGYLVFQNGGGRVDRVRLLSEAGMNTMRTPPRGVESSYAMGWFATKENGRPVLQHNGVLSTFYAEAVLLPKEKYGIAMLYNIQRPSTPGFTIKSWGLLIGVLTALTVGLGFRSLLHARQWVEEKRRRSFRRLLHVAWWLFLTALLNMTPLLFSRVNQPLPCGRGSVNVLSRDRKGADAQLFMTHCLAGMPWIVQWSSGRAFSYEELFRSILDLTIWLGLCAVLGLVNVAARIVLWIRMPVARGSVIERH